MCILVRPASALQPTAFPVTVLIISENTIHSPTPAPAWHGTMIMVLISALLVITHVPRARTVQIQRPVKPATLQYIRDTFQV